MEDEAYYDKLRETMVSEQIASRGVKDKRVLDAIRSLPRHWFVAKEYAHIAYSDSPLPIGSGQTISQPYIVALMTELLMLQGDETVLEIGTGSGYQAALLAFLARSVHTIERHAALAEKALKVIQKLNLSNVTIHVGDGSLGLPDFAPFRGIIITAAAPRVPKPLFEQLADDGRLVLPEGGAGGQMLNRWLKVGDDFVQEHITPVAFVPLRGEYGWKDTHWGFY
jgi:protein-L-isoaspartate(D-aspartate) O-methyltransferase